MTTDAVGWRIRMNRRSVRDRIASSLSWSKEPQHDVSCMLQMLFSRRGGIEVAPEDCRQRMNIGEVKKTNCGDRDVELGRVDPVTEYAGAASALKQIGDHTQKGSVHLANFPRPAQVFCSMQVLAVKQ